jgi:uncharacterized protein YabN with tetrapyrrole methylase and pyrophosphatase domain
MIDRPWEPSLSGENGRRPENALTPRTDPRRHCYLARTVSEPAEIILIGHGSGDALHLTFQAQSVLQRYGFAFAIGVPPVLTQLLTSSGVELDHLDERMLAIAEPRDSLLAAADVVLKQTEVESPVVVLVPGNPMFLNSLSRLLVAEGMARGLTVRRLAGISQFDLVVNELGIDVAARGIQVFDASQIARGRSIPLTNIPAVLFRASDLLADDGAPLRSFQIALAAIYPDDHPVTLFNADPAGDGTSFATGTISGMAEFADHLHAGSSLYIGSVSG